MAVIPAGALTGPLIPHLDAGLRRHNKVASAAAAIQLRIALHAGQVHADDHGVTGQVLVHLFRLLDAPAFRQYAAASSAGLTLVVSDDLYASVIRRAERPRDRGKPVRTRSHAARFIL